MNRRELLELVTVAGLASAATVLAADATPAVHAGHDHGAMGGRYADLIAATTQCIGAGEACHAHCITLLGEGERDLAACARTVEDTIAACTALRQLAAAGSPHVAPLARVVAGICSDCEKECRKHETHAVCRECAEACVRCARECQRLAG